MEDTANSRFSAALRVLDLEWRKWESNSDSALSMGCIDALNTFCTLIVSELPSDPELIQVYHAGVHLATVWHDCIRATEATDIDPGRIFDAVRAVRSHLDALDVKVPVELPKVADLLKQYGNDPNRYAWVAKEFGRYNAETDRWEGPFFGRSGAVLQAEIEKEARKPGSVIPADFTPPDVAARRKAAIEIARKTLSKLNAGVFRADDAVSRDPATIDQLLQEGQFPDVIAKVKGVTVDVVMRRARELGIVPVDRETLLSQAAESMNVNPVHEALKHSLPSSKIATPVLDEDYGSDEDDVETFDDEPRRQPAQENAVPANFGAELSGDALAAFVRQQLHADNTATNQAIQAAIAEAGFICASAVVREAAKQARKDLKL